MADDSDRESAGGDAPETLDDDPAGGDSSPLDGHHSAPEGLVDTGDEMRDRVPGSDWKIWILLQADRRLIAAAILGVIFPSIVLAGTLHPIPANELLTRGDSVETLFQALTTGTITLVTLVLTVGQLVLSQELGTLGDQRERMEGALAVRRDVEGYVEANVSPADPAAFLRELVAATGDRATEFGAAVDAADRPGRELRAAVDEYVDDVTGNAAGVTDQLRDAQFGTFGVVWAALNYEYSWKIYTGRRLRATYGDAFPDDAHVALDDLLSVLELFGPTREHFKTLYFQWELIDLSRAILFSAVPATVVSILGLLILDPQDLVGTTLFVSDALWVVAVAATVALVPLALLLSYVLRIVTVTKRTLSMGPFVLRETERETDEDEGDDG